MGGKKKAAKKGDGEGPDQGEIGEILGAEVEGLRNMLNLQQQRRENASAAVKKVIDNENIIKSDLLDQEAKTKEAVTQMSVQYRKMEERLTENINVLENVVETQEAEVKQLNEDILRLKDERDHKNQEMDEKINKLNLKINEMASEFADILKESLAKMQDRVEFANKDYSDADVAGDITNKINQLQQ